MFYILKNIIYTSICFSIAAETSLATDRSPQSIGQRRKTQGHQRTPTELLSEFVNEKKQFNNVTERQIDDLIINIMKRAEEIPLKLKNRNSTVSRPYDPLIIELSVCQVAIAEQYHQYARGADRDAILFYKQLLDKVKTANAYLIDQNSRYQLDFIDRLVVDSGATLGDANTPFTDIEIFDGYRTLWAKYDKSYILNMFTKATSFDQVMLRLFKELSDGFQYLSKPAVNDQVQTQGWKIHVSATPEGALKIASIVLPILTGLAKMQDSKVVEHKIVGSLAMLAEFQKDPTQRGKFITIYPRNDVEANQIAMALNQALRDIDKGLFDQVPNEAQLGTSGGLSTRYGCFQGLNLYKLDSVGNQVVENGEAVMILDDRNGFYKPDFISTDPFGALLIPPSEPLQVMPAPSAQAVVEEISRRNLVVMPQNPESSGSPKPKLAKRAAGILPIFPK